MKRILLITLICIFIFSLVGCSNPEVVQVNVSNTEDLSSNQFGNFIKIGDDLVYDSATNIVYRANYTYMGNNVYIPYYAPNGLPYKYNPETNTLEEINYVK